MHTRRVKAQMICCRSMLLALYISWAKFPDPLKYPLALCISWELSIIPGPLNFPPAMCIHWNTLPAPRTLHIDSVYLLVTLVNPKPTELSAVYACLVLLNLKGQVCRIK